MNRRILSSFFLLSQSVLFFLFSFKYLAIVCAGVALAVGFTFPQRFLFGRRWHIVWLVVLLGSLLGLRIQGLLEGRDAHGVFEFFAEFMIFVQLLEFFRRDQTQLADYFPGLGVITVACMFAQTHGGIRREATEIVAAFVVIYTMILLRPTVASIVKATPGMVTSKRLTQCVLGFFVVIIGWIVSDRLHEARPGAMDFLISVSAAERREEGFVHGYVGAGTLHHIRDQKLIDPKGIALTIIADTRPGYMRGTAYDFFNGGAWRLTNPNRRTRKIPPQSIPSTAFGIQDQTVHFLRDDPEKPYRKLTVISDPRRGRAIFMPLGTEVTVGESTADLLLGPHRTIRTGLSNGVPYTLFVTNRFDETLSDSERTILTRPILNDSVRDLQQLSEAVMNRFSSTREKVMALERYFDANYEYSDGDKTNWKTNGRSQLATFLLDRKPAHCEYFASGACVLLRYQGIPCRFVVGYRVYDMNDAMDAYLARNINAHAWAEAYDDQSGSWLIVEATPGLSGPSDMVPIPDQQDDRAETSLTEQTNEVDDGRRKVEWLNSGFVWEVMRSVQQQVAVPTALLLLAMLAILLRSRRRNPHRNGVVQREPKVLRRANKVAYRFGLSRGPSETWLQFAQRIRREVSAHQNERQLLGQLADWYQEYAAVRYRADADLVLQDLPSPPR